MAGISTPGARRGAAGTGILRSGRIPSVNPAAQEDILLTIDLEAVINKVRVSPGGFADHVVFLLSRGCGKGTGNQSAQGTENCPETPDKPAVGNTAGSQIPAKKVQITIDIITVIAAAQIQEGGTLQLFLSLL